MAVTSRRPGASGRTRGGVVSGAAVKAVREGVGLTQAQLAEDLGVDPNTVQSWEAGRRPLTSVRVGTLAALRRRLARAGAGARVGVIDSAIEADHVLASVLDGRAGDPFAGHVVHRDVVEALGWAFTGVAPAGLTGPAPVLGVDERAVFFAGLRRAVEESQRVHRGPGDVQPHRQLYYLLAWDEASRSWLAGMERAERRGWRPGRWTPRWVTARSVAISRARHGDPEPLRDFVTVGLADDGCRAADLAYWSYWVGDLDELWLDDAGMTGVPPSAWPGGRLLARFTDRLVPGEPLLDLYAASTSALVQARPELLAAPGRAATLLTRAEHLLDGDRGLHAGTRRHVEDLRYGLRLAAR